MKSTLQALVGLATGITLISVVVVAADIPAERRSGYDFMSRELRAMQDDEAGNPGMLAVLDGEALWQRSEGAAGKSCATCHGDARVSMKGVATRYPSFDSALGRPIDLEQRINRCRTDRQQVPPLPFEDKDLLALTSYVAHQSKGQPIAVTDDAQARPFIDAGRQIFERRQGQLNLSCSQCHDDNWDQRLGGAVIPQAHPTGYPIYRLEWQALGSLRRRLRSCLVGMRAETYPDDAPEIVALELYLGSVEIWDSPKRVIVIQAWDGSICAERRPVGEDGTALPGEEV
jgi:sulfur-oxidizing protein SoxA